MPEATPVGQPITHAPRRKSVIRRWWWRVGLMVLVVLVVLIAALPTILSTAPATRSIVSLVNGTIPGRLELDDLSLGWFSAMHVDGLRLRDPEGNVVAAVKSIDAPDASLRRVLGAYTSPGVIHIVEPTADIVAYEDGTTNLMRALVEPEDRPAKPKAPDKKKPDAADGVQFGDVSLRVEIDNARISYAAPDIERVELLARSTTLDVSSLHEQTLKLDATVRQGAEEGLIAATVKLSELIDDSLAVQSEKAHVEADVSLKAMPIPVVDRLSGQEGKLVALLGPKLDATLKAEGPLGQLTADLAIKSQHLNANASVGMQDQRLALKPGSRIALAIMPEAYAALMAPPPSAAAPAATKLTKPFDIVILINQLAIDQADNQLWLDTAAVDAEIAVGDIHLDAGPSIGRLDLQQTRLSAKTPRLADKLTVTFSSHAQQTLAGSDARGGGTINLTADLRRLIHPDGSINTTPSALVDATVTNLPVALVDELGQLGGLAVAAVGPDLNAAVKADLVPTADGWVSGTVKLTAKAQHLNAGLDAMLADTGLNTAPGSQITLAVQPALLDKLLTTPAKAAPVRLTQPFDVKLQLSSLNAPRKNGQVDLGALAIDAQVAVGDVMLDGGADIGQLALRGTTLAAKSAALGKAIDVSLNSRAEQNGRGGGIRLHAHVTDLIGSDGSFAALPPATIAGAITDLPLAIVDQLGGLDGLASAAVGPVLNATVEGEFDPASGKGELNLLAKATNLDATLAGTISNSIVTVGQGSRVVLTLQPAAVAKLVPPAEAGDPPAMALASPATITADLTHLVLPLQNFAADKATLGAKVRLDQLALAGDARLTDTAVRDLVVDLPAVRLDQPIAATLKGQLQRGDRRGAIDGHVKLTNLVAPPVGSPQTIVAALTLTAVPVELLDTLGQQQGKLAALLADVIDKVEVTVDATLGDTPRYLAAAKITDARLATDLGAIYTPTGLEVRDGSWATVTLTPDAFAAYHRLAAADAAADAAPLQLIEPLTLRADFKRSLIALGDAGLDPARTSLDARITSKGFSVRQGNQATPYAMRDLDVAVKTANLKDRLDLNVKAVIPSTTAPGQLTSTTTITKLYNEANEIDVNTLELTTDTTATAISVALLDVLANMQGKLIDTLGETADAKMVGKLPGDLDVALKSPLSNATVLASMNRERVLRLRQDATISAVFTQKLAQNVLGDIVPVLRDAVGGDQPIKLTLHQKGFRVPLNSSDLTRDVKLSGTLELGTLQMSRNGQLWSGLEVVGNVISSGKLRFPEKDRESYPVSFTPVEFRVADGQVLTSEVWITSPDLALGFQGGTDLIHSKTNMTMALPGATLISLIDENIQKYISPTAIMETSVGTKDGKLDIDWAAITRKLALQAGQSELQRQGADALGGLGDAILGGISKGATETKLTWNPPPVVAQLVEKAGAKQKAAPAQPRTPEERQRRREQRQQGQSPEAEPVQPQPREQPKPASPLEELLEQVKPREEPAKPAQPVVSDEERARRREERQRRREAERQQQNQ